MRERSNRFSTFVVKKRTLKWLRMLWSFWLRLVRIPPSDTRSIWSQPPTSFRKSANPQRSMFKISERSTHYSSTSRDLYSSSRTLRRNSCSTRKPRAVRMRRWTSTDMIRWVIVIIIHTYYLSTFKNQGLIIIRLLQENSLISNQLGVSILVIQVCIRIWEYPGVHRIVRKISFEVWYLVLS
jgi:hypothetical protein